MATEIMLLTARIVDGVTGLIEAMALAGANPYPPNLDAATITRSGIKDCKLVIVNLPSPATLRAFADQIEKLI